MINMLAMYYNSNILRVCIVLTFDIVEWRIQQFSHQPSDKETYFRRTQESALIFRNNAILNYINFLYHNFK